MEAEHGKSTDVRKGRVRTVALSKPVGLRRTIGEYRGYKILFSKNRKSGKSSGKSGGTVKKWEVLRRPVGV